MKTEPAWSYLTRAASRQVPTNSPVGLDTWSSVRHRPSLCPLLVVSEVRYLASPWLATLRMASCAPVGITMYLSRQLATST